MMNHIQHPLLLIGGGNMGRAIVEGAIGAGVLAGVRVVVLDPDAARHAPFEAVGAGCTVSTSDALARLDALETAFGSGEVATPGMILLAVKPQVLGVVAEAMHEAVGSSSSARPRLVLSILAGTPTDRLAEAIGGRVVRLMPNTPARIGLGMTAMCPATSEGAIPTADDLATTRTLFEAVGRVIDLPEDMLDAFTAVAGSGPAYLFHLAEGMAAGAEAVGFDRTQALDLVRATIAGAAGLLEAAAETDPADLRAMVTSKGGTTAAAVAVLEARAVREAMREAIVAARDRGRELAGG